MTHKDNSVETSRLLDSDTIIENAAVDVFESVITDHDDPNDTEEVRWLREERLHHKSLNWYKRPTVFGISSALLLNFTAMGVGMSAKVILLMNLICQYVMETQPTVDNCHDPSIQIEFSSLQSILALIAGVTCIIVSGKMGEFSDRFGRRPILIVIGITSVFAKIMIVYLLRPGAIYHKHFYMVCTALENLTGGNIVAVGVASSYITDIVEPHERIVSLGFMAGTLYGGLAIGPVLGTLVTKINGEAISAIYFELFLSILFLLVVTFFVTESRSIKLRRKSQSTHLRRKASFASVSSNTSSRYHQFQLWRVVDVFAPLKLLWLPKHPAQGFKPRYNLLILLFADVVCMLAGVAMVSTLILYATYRFDWATDEISYYVSMVGVSKAFCLYLVSPVILHLLRKTFKTKHYAIDKIDQSVISIALIFDSLGPLVIMAATRGGTLYASALFASLGALGGPSIQSTIVKYVSETKTGEIFGAMALIKNGVVAIGPTIFLQIYSRTVSTKPKITFLITYIFFLVAIFLLLFLRSHDEEDESNVVEEDIEPVEVDPVVVQSNFRTPRKSIDIPRR